MATKKTKQVEQALETKKVTNDTSFNISIWDIISTQEEVYTMVEHIHNDKVYMYQRWQVEKSPLRLCFRKSEIHENVKAGVWKIENNITELSKWWAIFPDSELITKAKRVIAEAYNNGKPIKLLYGNSGICFIYKYTIDWTVKCFRSNKNNLADAIMSNPSEMRESQYHEIVQKVLEIGKYSEYSLYVDNPEWKRIFISKDEVERYYEIPDYDAIVWTD